MNCFNLTSDTFSLTMQSSYELYWRSFIAHHDPASVRLALQVEFGVQTAHHLDVITSYHEQFGPKLLWTDDAWDHLASIEADLNVVEHLLNL